MEPLHQDDPLRIGPYRVLARARESAGSVRYLALAADGTPSVVALVRPRLAEVPVYRRRFGQETRTAQRLAGGWVEPVEASTDGTPLWTASGYVPAVTLREAITLAGPLPERTVRVLGAAIAETLSRVHATGTVLQGLSPDTVLLAADGPRLTALGPLGAAVVAEAGEDGQLTVKLGYLTPEQAAGAQPGPASDLFVLGQLLTYAATGTTPLADADAIAHGEPDLGPVADGLRPVVARCLAKSPEDRPPAGTVAADLALEGAAALARDGWLPDAVTAALSAQSAEAARLAAVPPEAGTRAEGGEDRATVLVRRGGAGARPATGRDTTPLLVKDLVPAEPRGTASVVPRPAVAPARQAAVGPPAPVAALPAAGAAPLPYTARALPPATGGGALPPLPPGPSSAGRDGAAGIGRRGLLVAAAAGAAGLVVGGTAVGALAGGEAPEPPAQKPAPAAKPRPMAGFAPGPQWRYEHPAAPGPSDGAPAGPLGAVVWQDRLLLLTDSQGTAAVDLRTGRRVWKLDEAASASRVVPVGTYCLVDTAEELLWVSAADGRVGQRLAKSTLARPGETLTIGQVLGSEGSTAWFTAHVRRTGERSVKGRKQKVTVHEAYVVAYDLAARAQPWRARVPEGRAPHTPAYQLVAVRRDDVLVRQDGGSLTPAQQKAARGGSSLLSLDRATGAARPGTLLTAVGATAAVTGDTSGRLYAAAGGELHAYTGTDGRRLWRVAAANTRGEPGVFAYGTPLVAGQVLYAANRFQQVCAVDSATGRELWRRSTQAPAWRETPVTALSPSGRTVLTGDAVQLTAFAARDGRRLWKFQEAGADDAPEQAAPRYAAFPAGARTVVRRGRTFYSLPVD
ncbi:PQQ-binding-like beta-propeller repeat protein [Streptomyces zhihengii]|uniref:outer membrane protein assembly factor BamB family protein n=1 Tax=Streptomyces zhihengii TaxID=1818004 RepID=UPI0036966930